MTGRPRTYGSDYCAPSERSIINSDHNQRVQAEIANEAFVNALHRYFNKGGRTRP